MGDVGTNGCCYCCYSAADNGIVVLLEDFGCSTFSCRLLICWGDSLSDVSIGLCWFWLHVDADLRGIEWSCDYLRILGLCSLWVNM